MPPALRTIYLHDRRTWRRWLRANYRTAPGIWLIYYRKATGKPRISYNDAVEEALCFGWIDSTVRKLDSRRFAQKFSPRKPKAKYSPANLERLRALAKDGKVVPHLLATLGPILRPPSLKPARDILEAIRANPTAWQNYRRFSDAYKRIRIGFVEGARGRPQEFRKRLKYFVRMTERNKTFGFGGIDKYY
jgi:hypothetical protein